MTVRLLAEGLDPLELDDWKDGIVVVAVEVGGPAARAVSHDRPRAHGTIDRSRYVGARAVTLSLEVVEDPHTRQALVDRMAPYMAIDSRLVLEVATEPGSAPRRLTVRPDEIPSLAWENAVHLPLSWQFRTVGAPWWMGEQRSLDLAPTGPRAGRAYDLAHPRMYPASTSTLAVAHHSGTIAADWEWTIAGPARRPQLRRGDTGETVALSLDLLDGQTAVVASADRSVTVDSHRHFGAVERATAWWSLPPRSSTPVSMLVAAATAAPPARLVWSDTYAA